MNVCQPKQFVHNEQLTFILGFATYSIPKLALISIFVYLRENAGQ